MNKVINYCHDCLDFGAAIDGYTFVTVAALAVQLYSLDKIDIDIDSLIVVAIAYDTVVDIVVYVFVAVAVAAAVVHSGGIGVVSMAVVHFAVSHASHASHYLLCTTFISFKTFQSNLFITYTTNNQLSKKGKKCLL